jgi:hypothetical protein
MPSWNHSDGVRFCATFSIFDDRGRRDLFLEATLSSAFTTFAATDSGVCFSVSLDIVTRSARTANVTVPASVPDHRRLRAEAVSSAATSASCYECRKHIFVFAVIVGVTLWLINLGFPSMAPSDQITPCSRSRAMAALA